MSRTFRRLSAAALLVATGLAWAPTLQAQSPPSRDRRPDQPPEEGPTVKLPESPGASDSQSAGRGFQVGSDPNSSYSGGGAGLVGPYWGAILTPEQQTERRIKKLIRRLG